MISIAIDKEKKLLTAVTVNTYLDDANEKVAFNIKYHTLPDGTQYPAATTLDAQAKKVKIVIEDSGFKKATGG